jgi:predicted ATPase
MHLNKVTLFPERYPKVDRYPFNLEVFQRTRTIDLGSPVTFFVGENGSGKSTLLQAITKRCSIYIWRGDQRARLDYNPYEEELFRAVEVEWTNHSVPGSFFASEIFKNFAQIVEEWATTDPGLLRYFGGKSLMIQSHGQSLMSFFKARFKIKGLYLLDEPETALSPSSQIVLLKLLRDMSQAGHAQFIVATHSPILLACPGAAIYRFDTIPLKRVEYEETEHFQVYKKFMLDPERYLRNA